MRKVLLIIKREYITRVREKMFLIATLAGPFMFVLFIFASSIFSSFESDQQTIAILDESGLIKGAIPDKSDQTLYFKKVQTLPDLNDNTVKYDGVVVIPENFDLNQPKRTPVRYQSMEHLGLSAKSFIVNSIEKQLQKSKIEALGLDESVITQLKVEIEFREQIIGDTEDDVSSEAYSIIGFIIAIALYASLMMYGTMIMNGVKEEKNNRIIEVMMSAVKPFQLLMGKIVGIGLVGLTQFVLWGVMIGILQFLLAPILMTQMPDPTSAAATSGDIPISSQQLSTIMNTISNINWIGLGVVGVFYFLTGFMLYGSLFAAIGALTDDDNNSQSMVFPVMIPIIIGFMIATSMMTDPYTASAKWGAIVPFTAPVVMPIRFLYNPPLWEVLLSMALMFVGFVGAVWVAAKIYRTAILMYGKKVSLKEILYWVVRS